MNLKRILNQRIPALASIAAGALYFSTIAPTISHTDSGELTAVCYTFGVAHPTGYPLFTLLGGIFTHLPLGSPAFNLNLMALLLMVGAVFCWGKTLELLFDAWRIKIGDDEALQIRFRAAKSFTVLIGCLGLAVGQTWWAQSTSGEVYSLHAFLLTLNLFLLFKAFLQEGSSMRHWLFFAAGLALLFSNHLTAVVLLPGVAWLFFQKMGFGKEAWKTLAFMLSLFFAILVLLYAWLPVRAGSEVPYAWGNPQRWEEIWHHVSGKQFSVWMFTGKEAFQKNLAAWLSRLPWEMGVGLLLMVPGVVYAWRYKRPWVIFFLVNVVVNVAYACNYAIKDLEPYFLLSLLSLSFFVAIGMRWVWLRMKINHELRYGISGIAGAGMIGLAAANFQGVDQRNAWQYEDYSRAALNSLPSGSIVLSQAWDVFVSPSYYLQRVEGVRPDIVVLDYPMLQNRHWYPDHIRRNYPELAEQLGPKLDQWEETVRDFDLRGKTDLQALSTRFQAVVWGILEQYKTRPVYFTPDLKDLAANPQGGFPLPPGMTLVPEQYFYRFLSLSETGTYRVSPMEMYTIRHNRSFGNPEDKLLLKMLEDILGTRMRYAQAFGRPDLVPEFERMLAGLPLPN